MITYQIRCKLKRFPKQLSTRTKADYDKLMRLYVSLKSLVDKLDDELSCHIILGSYADATASASLVAQASEEIGNLAQIRATIDKDAHLLLAQQTFIMISEKEMHFMAWKIVPIKKKFVMVTMSVTVNYVLLLDNLELTKF
ncbi:hypothetical protein TNIN_173741 [Trichonephila inaurata madagascariensis]|uniref:Uncharacterized protein n=2 Tax=Trichonephila inaurata madagascariensis TaxID=2747483 RepID=A0A8X7CNP3_9ARAC|nr:hypothetical protein TNIN_173741 [Trichonephila inaurata madagascariensis]